MAPVGALGKQKAGAPIRRPRPVVAMLDRLVGGVLRARSVARNHLPGPHLGEVPLVMFLTGVGQNLPGQLLVIAVLQTTAARAFDRSHFVLPLLLYRLYGLAPVWCYQPEPGTFMPPEFTRTGISGGSVSGNIFLLGSLVNQHRRTGRSLSRARYQTALLCAASKARYRSGL